MIVAFLSIFAYAIDWQLAVVYALVLPSLVALDTTGYYSEVFVFVILSLAVRFVKIAIQDDEV